MDRRGFFARQCRQELLIVVNEGLSVSNSAAVGTIQIMKESPEDAEISGMLQIQGSIAHNEVDSRRRNCTHYLPLEKCFNAKRGPGVGNRVM
jgi:hypothetical protein